MTPSSPSSNTNQLVMTKLLELSVNMSEVLKGFSNNIAEPNRFSTDISYFDTDRMRDHQLLQQSFQQNQPQMVFPSQSDSQLQSLESPLSVKGTFYQLPFTAFKPQTEQLIESPLISNSFQFDNKNYTSQPPEWHHNINFNDQANLNSNNNFTMTMTPEEGESHDEEGEHSSVSVVEVDSTASKYRKRSVNKKPCRICNKVISRDMSRHLRTHDKTARFQCLFPHVYCRHRSGKFNRPYDFKKHLLNYHFKYDDPDVKKLHNLSDKLMHVGTCSCGMKFNAKQWLEEHILTADGNKQCPYLDSHLQGNIL